MSLNPKYISTCPDELCSAENVWTYRCSECEYTVGCYESMEEVMDEYEWLMDSGHTCDPDIPY